MTDTPQAIDWPGIRAAAVTLGISGAARAAAAHLPEDERERFRERVCKLASREGWATAQAATMTLAPKQQGPAMPLSKNVQNGADAMQSALADDERETRLSLSRSARNLASQGEAAELHQAGDVLQAGKLAALVHRWEAGSGGQAPSVAIQVNIG